jgi:hypothetical protein
MKRSIRIPVWYVLPLLVVALVAFLGGGFLRTGAAASHPTAATTLTATVTRILTQTITRTVAIATPTEPPKLAAVATTVSATDTPAPTPSPTPPTETPAPPTATSVPTASPTVVPPTATAMPPASLQVGQALQHDGMTLDMVTSAYDGGCCYGTYIDFQAENHTNSTLNFDLGASDVLLQFSGGKQLSANNKTGFNNFAPDDKLKFHVEINIGWDAFQALERDAANTYYTVTIAHFSSHITGARWRVDLAH